MKKNLNFVLPAFVLLLFSPVFLSAATPTSTATATPTVIPTLISTDKWYQVTPMLSKYGHCAVVFNDEICVNGGSTSNKRLNSKNGSDWEVYGFVSANIMYGQLLSYNGYMYFFFGMTYPSNIIVQYVYKYTPGGAITNLIPTCPPRRGHMAAVFDDGSGEKMWLYGGYDTAVRNDIWTFTDQTACTQATANALPGGRASGVMLSFKGRLYIIGGFNGASQLLNDVWSSGNGVDWSLVTGNAQFSPRAYFGGMVYDDKMWVTGGMVASGSSNETFYSEDGITWMKIQPEIPYVQRDQLAAVIYDRKLWVIGGYNSGITPPTGQRLDSWYLPLTSVAGAADSFDLTYTVSGDDLNWFGQRETYINDHDAVQAGNINDNEATYFSTTIPAHGEMSFYWKVSCQAGDELSYYTDAVKIDSISGNVDWQQKTIVAPQGIVVSWKYAKDASGSEGYDTGWVDNIVYIKYTPTVTPTRTETATITDSPTASETPTVTETDTETATMTDSETPSYTCTYTATPTETATDTATETFTVSPEPTATGTFTASLTITPSITRTCTLAPTVTRTPTIFVPLSPGIKGYYAYPSPVDDVLTIVYSLYEEADVFIRIYNVAGEMIADSKTHGLVKPDNTVVINLEKAPAGIYLYSISARAVSGNEKILGTGKFAVK